MDVVLMVSGIGFTITVSRNNNYNLAFTDII